MEAIEWKQISLESNGLDIITPFQIEDSRWQFYNAAVRSKL